MRVLVTYGSKEGGTAGLAEAVAEGLEERGHRVDLRPAAEIDGLEDWDAVVVGGALYVWRWHRDARRFVVHHVPQLREMPVWFFSSGPLDESADEREIPPLGKVGRLMNKVEAKGHRTFGGRIEEDTGSPLPTGDWRNMDAAREWGGEIGAQLDEMPAPAGELPELESRRQRRARRVAETLCLFTGITALFGGGSLILSPQGASAIGLPLSMLEGTPFSSFLVPGLLLFFVVGGSNLVAGIRLLRRRSGSDLFAAGAGVVLSGWIVVQMAMLGGVHWLQLFYLAVGVATVASAVVAHRFGRSRARVSAFRRPEKIRG